MSPEKDALQEESEQAFYRKITAYPFDVYEVDSEDGKKRFEDAVRKQGNEKPLQDLLTVYKRGEAAEEKRIMDCAKIQLENAIRCSTSEIKKNGQQNVFWEATCVMLFSISSTWEGEEFFYNPIADVIWYHRYTMHLDDGDSCSAPCVYSEEEMLAYIREQGRRTYCAEQILKLCQKTAEPRRRQLQKQLKTMNEGLIQRAIRHILFQIQAAGRQDSFSLDNCVLLYRQGGWEGVAYYFNPIADLIWSHRFSSNGKECSEPHVETEEALMKLVRENSGDTDCVKNLLEVCRQKASAYRDHGNTENGAENGPLGR